MLSIPSHSLTHSLIPYTSYTPHVKFSHVPYHDTHQKQNVAGIFTVATVDVPVMNLELYFIGIVGVWKYLYRVEKTPPQHAQHARSRHQYQQNR